MAEPDALVWAIGLLIGFWLMLVVLFYIFLPR